MEQEQSVSATWHITTPQQPYLDINREILQYPKPTNQLHSSFHLHTLTHSNNPQKHFHNLTTETLTERKRKRERMAYSACFLHQSALASSAARSSSSSSSQRHVSLSKPVQIMCKAQQPHEDDNSAVSRRLALTLLVGAAAVGSKVSPADAAYGEAGANI